MLDRLASTILFTGYSFISDEFDIAVCRTTFTSLSADTSGVTNA
jgi:hypothetical protein